MTQLERQVQIARRRLWLIRWFDTLATSLAAGVAVFAVTVLMDRLFALGLAVGGIGCGLVAAATILSIVWTHATRPTAELAAMEVDRAAGLSERLSSSLYCRSMDDPFAQAVVQDADRVARSIRVQQHIRFAAPRSLSWVVGSTALAAATFLVTPGLLKSSKAAAVEERSAAVVQAHVAVKKQLEPLRKFADLTPAVEEFEDDLGTSDPNAGGELHRAEDVRHEAIKKIDRLEDALKKKRESETYQAVGELSKMLRRLEIPDPSDPTTQKIANSLAKGDFKTAKEEIEKLKEQLATLQSEEDKKFAEKMSRQLDQLANNLEEIAKDDRLKQKLEQAGIEKEDAQRMLERLSKKDLDQLQKQLEQQGMSQKQIQTIKKQLQQKQQARTMAQKMAQGMKRAGKGCRNGQAGESMAGLKMAGDQLSQLEQLEQELNELESAMAGLQQAKQNIDKPCPG